MSQTTQIAATHHLTIQFLNWVMESPRTYGDVMEAWRTSCPRMPIWEDAVTSGYVRIDHRAGASRNESSVTITPRGRALLAEG